MLTKSEILEIARQAEEPKTKGKLQSRSQKKATGLAVDEDKENKLESVSGESESDCIVVAGSGVI